MLSRARHSHTRARLCFFHTGPVNNEIPANQKTFNSFGQAPGGGPKGYNVWNRPQFYRPSNFWWGGWTDPFGCIWRNGLYVTNIVINSVAIYGWWTGGCCGCGRYYYNGGASYCGPCTFWNGYQVGHKARGGEDGSQGWGVTSWRSST